MGTPDAQSPAPSGPQSTAPRPRASIPVVILATLAIWSSLWGVAGAFLSVPMTVVVALALSEFDQTRPIAVLLSREGKV